MIQNENTPLGIRLSRLIILCLYLLVSFLYQSLSVGAHTVDLTELSLEELMDITVTSVGKKEQSLADSAAAIFVITAEDLRRTGVTNIPDALRMVPGLNVARIDANKWAVSSRFSNSRFFDKLLVLIDGRSIYSPSFSGVYWEAQDVMLEDVARIEVIRGPGATLWGANAVNGVINIITRPAQETQGGLVSVGGGNFEKGFAGVRYGTAMGDNGYTRLYAKGFERDEFQYADGSDAKDDWDGRQAGFRFDSPSTYGNQVTVQGDIYQRDVHQIATLPSLSALYNSTVDYPAEYRGGNLLGRWEQAQSSRSDTKLQAYFEQTHRKESYSEEKRDTFDVEFQHHLRGKERHDFIWGAHFRGTWDDFVDSPTVVFDPKSRNDNLFSLFLQDEMTLVPDQLIFTFGSKFEHNDLTGFEFQPSARLSWSVNTKNKVWVSISRAVRTPSRVETSGQFVNFVALPETNTSLPVIVTISGNDDFESEILYAYEMGYRFLPSRRFTVDLSLFYNDYRNLKRIQQGEPEFLESHINIPYRFGNDYENDTYGIELAASWKPWETWKLDLAYTYLNSDMEESFQFGSAPRHQVSFRSSFNLGKDVDLDLWLRYVDDATVFYVTSPDFLYNIDEYITADVHLSWRPLPALELTIVGQNLLDRSHLEFVQEIYSSPTEVARCVYGKITYEF